MDALIGVVLGIVGVIVAFLGYRMGSGREREQNARIAKEAEARKRAQAALDAGEAMKSAAAERDAALKRPAGTVVGDAMRRGQ